MTIIKPNKKRNEARENFLVVALFVALITGALTGVFFYNRSVNYRHELSGQKSAMDELEVRNAEIKDGLYRIIDIKSPGELAARQSLVLDSNPQYIKKEQLAGR